MLLFESVFYMKILKRKLYEYIMKKPLLIMALFVVLAFVFFVVAAVSVYSHYEICFYITAIFAVLFIVVYILYVKKIIFVEKVNRYFEIHRFYKRGYVWQYIKNSYAKKHNCEDIMPGLISDLKNLPNELPPGKYTAITHDTVLNRFKNLPFVKLKKQTSVYESSLEKMLSEILYKKCKDCKKKNKCRYKRIGKSIHSFYYIKFEILPRNAE